MEAIKKTSDKKEYMRNYMRQWSAIPANADKQLHKKKTQQLKKKNAEALDETFFETFGMYSGSVFKIQKLLNALPEEIKTLAISKL